MKLENVVPWGRNLQEYQNMFQLSNEDLQSKILGCGDGPSSFNFEVTKIDGNITSIDPIYQFTKDEIQTRIDTTLSVVRAQLKQNQNDFVWKNIKNVDELVDIRLTAMSDFIKDYENGKKEQRYIHNELPKLSFENNSFDLVLSSHFLFLYSEHFDLQFHIDSILEMCRVSKKEVRIFPLLDLKNNKSKYLKPILDILKDKGFETKIIKTNYEFQKGANELLSICKITNFLKETEIINYSNQQIQKLAKSLSDGCKTDVEIAKRCFLYVRDEINHSGDYKDNITTCRASDVLKYKTGWCYAKSHLLAALLRANNIPTGFCYQRLSCSEYVKDVYCLHGLNAIYLKEYGWYRVDARGNKKGVDAEFNPPIEKLAFQLQEDEFDLPKIYEEPLEIVVQTLEKFKTYDEMCENFPDIRLNAIK